MYLKIHRAEDREVVSLCDKELIGKTLEEKDLQLKVSESFYKGEEESEEKTLKILKQAYNLNIVGKRSVDFCLKHNLINKENIIMIQGVPHAQVYMV